MYVAVATTGTDATAESVAWSTTLPMRTFTSHPFTPSGGSTRVSGDVRPNLSATPMVRRSSDTASNQLYAFASLGLIFTVVPDAPMYALNRACICAFAVSTALCAANLHLSRAM